MARGAHPTSSADAEIAAAKRELRARGWYVRYTEWPLGHQVVIHLRSDPATHLVTPWCATEAEAYGAALSLAAERSRGVPAERRGPGAREAARGDGRRQDAARRDLDLVVVGGATAELVVRARRLPGAGEVAPGDLLLQRPGGEGAGVAIAAARLGARAALVARIGQDAHGEAVLGRLRAHGVDVARVQRDPEAPTAVALVHLDRRGRRTAAILSQGDANARLSPAAVREGGDALGSAAVVVGALDVAPAAVAEALRIARRSGAQTLLDAALPRKVPDRLLALADVVRVAAPVAEIAIGARVRGRRSAARAAQTLLRRGAAAAAIDLAGEGAALVTRGEVMWISAPPAKVIEPSAATAAFCAALALGLAEGLELEQAGRLACAASAAAGGRVEGVAALPPRAELSRAASESESAEELILDGESAADAPRAAPDRDGAGDRPGSSP